ncbi:MAG TPA: hypothetical protein VGD88_06205 [Opitutaceae bacterium]
MSTAAASPFVRVVQWIVINGLLLCALWLGWFEGVEWARNLFTFVSGFFALLSLALISKDLKEGMRKRGRTVPAPLDGLLYAVFVGVLAAMGSFWVASAWVLMWMIDCYVFSETKGGAK